MGGRVRTPVLFVALLLSMSMAAAVPAAGAITCNGLTVTISGTSGDDIIDGTNGDDVIHARGGKDVVNGKGGNDTICGAGGADVLNGGAGNDTILGGGGPDRISGGGGADVIKGGNGADRVWGDGGSDTVEGGAGDDTLRGGKNRDTVRGGKNADRLFGNGGGDTLHGGSGNDTATGGPGWDDCYSADRADPCEGPAFVGTFDGDPASPTPFKNSEEFSVSINSRVGSTRDRLASMQGQHDASCNPPPATHTVRNYDDAVYNCRNHMMTAISAGPDGLDNYAVAMFSPNQLLDFSGGEATITFDVSTLRASKRDWFEVWITPYKDLLRIPVQHNRPSMQGSPRNGVVVALKSFTDIGSFDVQVVKDFKVTEIDGPVEWIGYESFLTPSATVRSTFEIKISKDHISVGMPDEPFYWISEDIPGGLDFDKAVVQFGHNSYDVFDCDSGCGVGPNTWHWDNIYLAPAEPITALPASRRHVDADSASFVTFGKAAPKNAHLQFTGVGFDLEVSFDSGATWQPAVTQHNREIHHWRYKNYWMPVPKGTKRVDFRGTDPYDGHWQIQDISILAKP